MAKMKTTCIRCHQRCVIDAEVKDGKVVEIKGFSCVKGQTIPDVMYHPDRLLYPLKRAGERGEGKWQRISWDEAFNTIVSKLTDIREKHGREALHVSMGSGQKHMGMQVGPIARKFLTPNTHSGRYTCIIPQVMSEAATTGENITYEINPDFAASKCIMYWGANPDVGTPSQVKDARSALRKGAKLIVMDPRPTPMAKRADIWLKIRPGTDTALGLAMLNVVINEELYDKEFVDNYCFGFDKLKEHVQKFTPEWAAEITWLSKEDIVRAARMYATTKPATVYARNGAMAQQVNSSQVARVVDCLVAICGYVDVPGGSVLFFPPYVDAMYQHGHIVGSFCGPPKIEIKQLGAKQYPMMFKWRWCDVPLTVQAMEEGSIKALWCVTDNLIVAEMDNRRIWDIMKNKLEFIFVSEFFMTPTAELADIVLPAAFYTEYDNVVESFVATKPYVMACKKMVEPPGECKDDREVVMEIVKRMGMDLGPWGTVRELLDWRFNYLGLTFDEVWGKPDHKITFPMNYRRYETRTPPFNTPSGKVELYSQVFEALGVDPLPTFEEPPESPVSTPELFKEFPLIYTHYRLLPFQHSEGRQIERQRKMEPDPWLEINSEMAAKLGISDGDWVYLETPTSKKKGWHLNYKARLVPEMLSCVVAGPHGWWFPEKPGPEHGCFDSNINALLTLDPPYDPIVGNPQCRAILCRVWKAESQ